MSSPSTNGAAGPSRVSTALETSRPRKGRFEPGDILFALFTLVLVRQLFWLLPNAVAWTISVALTGVVVVARFRWCSRTGAPLPRLFWIVVALPLFLLWVLRIPRPDLGWDVLNYHLLHGERALLGLLAIPGDFYPYFFPFLDPAPDMVAAILRLLLGYRLGTIGSLLALCWTAAIVFRLLEGAIRSVALRGVATLWIVGTEGVLLQLGNYMVDLYGIPLLLEAVRLTLPDGEDSTEFPSRAPAIGLLLGMAVAVKLTNLPFALAIALAGWAAAARDHRSFPPAKRTMVSLTVAALLFGLPLLPHALHLWWTTGNPVFPHYNAIFRSPLFPEFDIRDVRFGPKSAWEALVWPVLSTIHPSRLSELGMASGRMALGFAAALVTIPIFFRKPRLVGLAAIVAVGGILWGLGTGYARYGVFLEVLGGVLLVLLFVESLSSARTRSRAGRAVIAAVGLALLVQTGWILWFVERGDWSGRPTALYRPGRALRQLGRAGSDRNLLAEVPSHLRPLFERLGGWVDVVPKTNGIMALLAPDLPMVDFLLPPLLDAPANGPRYNEALRVLEGKPLAALAYEENVSTARSRLREHGFRIRREEPFLLPFFSSPVELRLVALFVEAPPPGPPAPGESSDPTAREMLLRRPPRRNPR